MHYNPVISFKENDNFIIVWSDSDEGGFGQKGSSSLNENEPEKFLKSYQNKGNEPDVFAQLFLNDWRLLIQFGREYPAKLRKLLSVNDANGKRTHAGSFIQAPDFAIPLNRK